jgi:hypothetical protein
VDLEMVWLIHMYLAVIIILLENVNVIAQTCSIHLVVLLGLACNIMLPACVLC